MTPSESTQPTPTSQLNPEDTSCGIDYPTAIVCEELHRRRVRRFEDMLVDYRDNPEFADGVRVVQSYMSSRNFTREELDRGLALYETGALQIHGVNLGEKVFETTGWMVTHESAETLLPKQYRNLLEDVAHVRSFFYINKANLRVIEETPGRWIYLFRLCGQTDAGSRATSSGDDRHRVKSRRWCGGSDLPNPRFCRCDAMDLQVGPLLRGA